MRRRSPSASGSRQRKWKESDAQEVDSLPVYARHGSSLARCGHDGRSSSVGDAEGQQDGCEEGRDAEAERASADFDFVDPQLAYRTDDWSMLYTTAMQLVSFPEKTGAAGSQLYPAGCHRVPDGLEGREDLHVPHPPGAEVQRRLARHRSLVPAGVGADPEPEDGLAARRQPRPSGRDRRRHAVPRTGRPRTSRASRRRARR